MSQYKQTKIISATEGTIGTDAASLEAHSFQLDQADFVGGGLPKVSANNLGAQVVALWEDVGGLWVEVRKSGTVVTLDTGRPQEAINCYGKYAVSKASASTGCEVWVTHRN